MNVEADFSFQYSYFSILIIRENFHLKVTIFSPDGIVADYWKLHSPKSIFYFFLVSPSPVPLNLTHWFSD